MKTRKDSKAHVQRERSSKKLKRALKSKGYKSGKAPKGKVAHHIKPLASKGKTTKKNINVISAGKHKRIHRNRRKQGKI